jgi:hypothetical protein
MNYLSGSNGLSTASVLATLVTDLGDGFDEVLSSNTNASSNGKSTLIADHCMSVYGYDSTTGDLEIRNPWGTESGQTWDTTFEISLGTLLSDGDTITTDNATSSSSEVVTGALVSAAAGLQSNAQVSTFTIADTAANVAAALASLGAESKLTSITLTDAGTPAITLTMAQYTAATAVLAKIASLYALTVTGALVSSAAALQATAGLAAFTVTDSSANVVAGIAALNADTKLSSITLTDTNALSRRLCAVHGRYRSARQTTRHLYARGDRRPGSERGDRAGQQPRHVVRGLRYRGQRDRVADRAER